MKLLLGVTASVAAKLTPKLTRAIATAMPETQLRVVATERSLHFFNPDDINAQVFTDADEWRAGGYVTDTPVLHIDFGEWADAILIAPLTADTLADMAHGKTDTFLTSIALAWPREKPMILAPAMNTRMWTNPLTQKNLQTVRNVYQAQVIEPVTGHLACGTDGIGAMAHIDTIVGALRNT